MIARSRPDMREEVLAYVAEEGFTREFVVREEGFVDTEGRALYRPEEVRVNRIYRFSGSSEAHRMDLLYTLVTRTGVRGWVAVSGAAPPDPLLEGHLARTGGVHRRYPEPN